MKWTFGIITDGLQEERLANIIASIQNQDHVDDYEIIVVGGDLMWFRHPDHLTYVRFDETVKQGWITRKKNIVAERAKYPNLCIMHDYVRLNTGWVSGFERFGAEWKTVMTPVQNKDGQRFRDWCVIYNDAWMEPPIDDQQPPESVAGRLISYEMSCGHERWQYFSGAYFCVKRDVILNVPLDESRVWGQGEDVQWSRLLYQKYGRGIFSLNTGSSVRFLKEKEHAPWEGLVQLG